MQQPDHRQQVHIGRHLLAERVIRGNLNEGVLVAGQTAKLCELAVGNLSVDADAGEVIDDHRRIGILLAQLVDRRQGLGIDQQAHLQVALGAGAPHRGHALAVEILVGRFAAGSEAKAAYALLGKVAHRVGDLGLLMIDDRHAGKHAGMRGDGVEHVGVVVLVIAHLNEHDPIDAAGPRMREEFVRRERRRLHVGRLEARGERILLHVGRPHVNVGVDVTVKRRRGRRRLGRRLLTHERGLAEDGRRS